LKDQKVVIAGACDPKCPGKCFSTSNGSVLETFPSLSNAAMSLDITKDKNQLAFGDMTGKVHFEKINYSF